MKKKILSLLIAFVMIIPMTLSLVACDKDNDTDGTEATKQSTMAADNIELAYESTVYDGTEKKPTVVVKYDDEVVDADEYTVEYSNNINAGKATVTVKAKDDSTVLEEGLTFTKTFVIERAPIAVATADELNAAVKITDANHMIKLTQNIAKVQDKVVPILIFPETKDYDVVIDLAGYDVNSYFNIRSVSTDLKVKTNYNANVSIINSSTEESVVGSADDAISYAVVIRANAEGKFVVDFENVKFQAYWGGISTNGSDKSEAEISAKNCKFIGTKVGGSDGVDTSVGAFLPAGHYEYEFESCTFEGYTGYFAKSGHHKLVNCTVKGNGELAFPPNYYGNGCSGTGSALVAESCEGYNNVPLAGYPRALTIDIIGGTYLSETNFAIQEYSSYKNIANRVEYAFIHITDDPILEGAGGVSSVENEGSVIGL